MRFSIILTFFKILYNYAKIPKESLAILSFKSFKNVKIFFKVLFQ